MFSSMIKWLFSTIKILFQAYTIFNFRDTYFQIWGYFEQINNFFVTNNCKKTILKNSDKDKFLVGSVHNLQSNWNSDFQENVLQEYYKNGGDSWLILLCKRLFTS